MKIGKYILIGLVAVFVIAAGVIAYLLNSVVSGAAKDRITSAASQKLGTKVDLQSYGLSWGSILRLKPAVTVNGLAVANPSGYPARNMLEAETVEATLDLTAVLQKRVRVTSLNIQSPKVLIETNAQGKSNLETVLNSLKKEPSQQASAAPAAAAAPGPGTETTVDEVVIKNGQVAIASQAEPQPEVALRDLSLKLANLAPDRPCDIDLAAELFAAGSSQVKLAGKAGPFQGDSLPFDGKAAIGLPLAEIPTQTRQKRFGDLAADPGKDSRVDAEIALKGDLYQTTEGTGQLKITKLLIGPGQQGRLALDGTAPLAIKAVDLISVEMLELRAPKAAFNLGSGKWAGDLLLRRQSENLNGSINGAIQGVDVNQMLTSFAGTPNKVYGTLAIPQFALTFAGANADQLQKSLGGQGRLTITNGKFQGLSVLAAIERALGGGQTGQEGAFAQFVTNFAIQKQVIALNGIAVDGPGIQIGGQGSVTFAKALNFNLQSKLTGATADRLRGLSRGFVAGDIAVPVQIAGTVDNPQVRPEMKGLMQGAAKSAIKGVLENFLGGKKKK